MICSHTGEMMLMLETKSKLASGSKVVKSDSGTFKRGKPAWRIDDGEAEYFNLVSYGVSSVKDLKEEAMFSKQFEPFEKELIVYELGATFDKNAVAKMSVYAPKAEASLEKLLSDSNQSGSKVCKPLQR